MPVSRVATAITAATAALAATAATAAIARAQPPAATAAASVEPRDAVHTYLEPGVAAGVATSLYGALELDAGYRLGESSLWIHGRVSHGTFTTFSDRILASSLTDARLGLEARGCTDNGIACLVGGVDFAYRHELLSTANEDPTPHTTDITFVAAVARVGLDLGTRHVRFRPSVELGVRQGGWSNLGATTGLAFAW